MHCIFQIFHFSFFAFCFLCVLVFYYNVGKKKSFPVAAFLLHFVYFTLLIHFFFTIQFGFLHPSIIFEGLIVSFIAPVLLLTNSYLFFKKRKQSKVHKQIFVSGIVYVPILIVLSLAFFW
jgi:hypothetical protein